jgi:hypothetical protein
MLQVAIVTSKINILCICSRGVPANRYRCNEQTDESGEENGHDGVDPKRRKLKKSAQPTAQGQRPIPPVPEFTMPAPTTPTSSHRNGMYTCTQYLFVFVFVLYCFI